MENFRVHAMQFPPQFLIVLVRRHGRIIAISTSRWLTMMKQFPVYDSCIPESFAVKVKRSDSLAASKNRVKMFKTKKISRQRKKHRELI